MNLRVDGLELVQAPTWITYMIMSYDDYGKPQGGWRGIVHRYRCWLFYERQCAFNNHAGAPDEQRAAWEYWTRKVQEIEDLADRAHKQRKKLHFTAT